MRLYHAYCVKMRARFWLRLAACKCVFLLCYSDAFYFRKLSLTWIQKYWFLLLWNVSMAIWFMCTSWYFYSILQGQQSVIILAFLLWHRVCDINEHVLVHTIRFNVHFVIHSLIPPFSTKKFQMFTAVEAFRYIMYVCKIFFANSFDWGNNRWIGKFILSTWKIYNIVASGTSAIQ